jgi:hypothetical protein
MSFDFNAMREVAGLWYLAWADKDWLCVAWRESPITGWTVRYRIRYYDPREPDPWAGVDRRSWYEGVFPADTPREQIVDAMRRLVA